MQPPLTAEKAVAWLNRNWKGSKQCPVCQNNDWNVGGKPIELREFHGGDLVVGSPVYPVLLLTCKVCGNILLFNAIVAGLVVPKQPDTESAPTKKGATASEKKGKK